MLEVEVDFEVELEVLEVDEEVDVELEVEEVEVVVPSRIILSPVSWNKYSLVSFNK